VAAYAEISGDSLTLRGLFPLDNGDYSVNKITGSRAEAVRLGQTLAEQMPDARV